MQSAREFVYDQLLNKHNYPKSPVAECMFEIQGTNFQLYDELAKHNAFDYGDYSIKIDKRITYQFKYLEQKDKEIEKTGLFCIINNESNLHQCLYFQRPFLYFGPVDFYKDLQSKGYKLHDRIFDYAFDNIDNPTQRREAFVDQVLRLKRFTNPSALQKSLEVEVIHNRKTFFKHIDEEQFPANHYRLNTLQKFRKLL